MSLDLILRALQVRHPAGPIHPTVRLVLVQLAEHAAPADPHTGGEPVAWPSLDRLADLCDVHRDTARRALRELVELQLVEVLDDTDDRLPAAWRAWRPDRRPTAYLLTLPPVDNAAARGSNLPPRNADGVAPMQRRGGTHATHGVAPMQPEPPNEPPKNPARANGSTTSTARPVDNGGRVPPPKLTRCARCGELQVPGDGVPHGRDACGRIADPTAGAALARAALAQAQQRRASEVSA